MEKDIMMCTGYIPEKYRNELLNISQEHARRDDFNEYLQFMNEATPKALYGDLHKQPKNVKVLLSKNKGMNILDFSFELKEANYSSKKERNGSENKLLACSSHQTQGKLPSFHLQ
mmetsp:Transcript_39155/g.37487  ORF Transcript_39155/g.37487 Transcript_39155/m.37487 type:complete len:115 (+) Transcript_39155:232-576(+)